MAIQLESLVESIKSKVRALKKPKKPYIKMDKSSSVKVEIRSRKAKKLIDKTMRAADSPGKRTISNAPIAAGEMAIAPVRAGNRFGLA